MTNNLPTTPGPYWWREKDGDEWELWHVDKDVNQPGLTCRKGFNVSTPEKLGGQWAKAHKPDEGIEAWAVFKGDEFFVSAPIKRLAQQAARQAMYGRPDYWNALEVLGGTCEPVTIYRNQKNK